MLLEASKVIKPSNIYKYPWKGKVIDNQDPKKLGRLKVQIDGLLEGDASSLPWVMMKNSTGFGGTGKDSSFIVPLVGSEVNVTFPYDDIYFPVYDGFYQSSKTHQAAFDDNYPNKFGFQADQTKVIIDRQKNTATIEMGNGVKITVSENGEVEIEQAKILVKATEIVFNEKMSGITTHQSHFGVVDMITGIECIPSQTTFGDV